MQKDFAVKRLEERVASLERRLAMTEQELMKIRQGLQTEGALAYIVANNGWTMDKTKAAKLLGVTRATVYTMIADGRLEQLADGRIPAKSIADYLDGCGGRNVSRRSWPKRVEEA